MSSLPVLVVLALSGQSAGATLPGTSPWTLTRPADEVMLDGIHRICEHETARAREQRAARWRPDDRSAEAHSRSTAANRERFQRIVGVVDERTTTGKTFELVSTLEAPSEIARSPSVTVHAVRWQVLDGLTAEGLLLVPDRVRARVVTLPDADCSPEDFCGITDTLPPQAQLPRRLAEAGCLVAVPVLIGRRDEYSGHPRVGFTNQTHREFIYRQAYEMGRHVIGFEVQKVLAAIDLFKQMKQPDLPIGVAGVSEGALIALYSSALDERIDATLVAGYFRQRENVWREPIYRNVWRLLTEWGDAELAAMIAPRCLVLEACRIAEIPGPPEVRPGRRDAAAPGSIVNCPLQSVQTEHQRAAAMYGQLKSGDKLVLAVSGRDGQGTPGSRRACSAFLLGLGIEFAHKSGGPAWRVLRAPKTAGREKRQFLEMQECVQLLLRNCHQRREARWKADLTSIATWLPTKRRMQRLTHRELIGQLRIPPTPPNPRSRLVVEEATYVGYQVVLDVAPDLIASGILLLPRDLRPEERRPVIVCQHGLEGLAEDTLSDQPPAFRAYQAFAAELCRRGFVVYCPQNPYRGGDRFRSVQRKANPLGLSLFSFIIEQHRRTLDWLATLPNVDPERIAFYGLSYGGKTAMRVPPLLNGYCLAICSGDFTDWAQTITTNSEPYGYLFTGEYEIPEWNLGHVAGYAELAMLMSPRPFMVEAGHRDAGQPSELVGAEFAKVRRHYDTLGIPGRAALHFFDGPHTIDGGQTFDFLHRHLNWQDRAHQQN